MAEDAEAAGLVAHSYTNFFKIRKRIRRIQDIPLPFKRGLGTDQFVTFILVFIVLAIINFAILSPIFSLFSIQMEWSFYLVYFLAPPVIAAQKIGSPMPNGKSIPGTAFSYLRAKLDDPIHRRGMPLGKVSPRGKRLHYVREWTPSVAADAPFEVGEGDAGYFYGPRVDLEGWMANKSVEHSAVFAEVTEIERTDAHTQKLDRLLKPDARVRIDNKEND